MNQAPCDHLPDLEKLLADELSPDRAARLVAHVETCEPCQRRLERLVSRPLDGLPAGATRFGDEATAPDNPVGAEESATAFGSSCETAELRPASMTPPSTVDEGTRSAAGDTDPAQGRGESNRLPGRPAIPGYELMEQLGEGGMGVVYLARQAGLNRMVAVKMIRGGQQARPDHFARFRIEAEAVARLHHPHILQIYEIGEADDLPFVSLELLRGGSLADRLDGTPRPGREAAELLITLARAVQAAHDEGIVHRDLKPSNVLFTDDGVPKVTDFGLAKRMESDSRQTETGQIMGSPSYMAPEQARGHARDVGPASDVYALGAILYEMLTGRPPFKGETPMETVRQVIDDEPVPPSRLVPRIARDLETIGLKCLDKDPSRRYATAAALADDLGRYRNGETILARRTPAIERALKWARRRPAAAALILLATGLLVSLPSAWIVRHEQELVARERRSLHLVALHQEALRLIDAARDANSRDELSSTQNALSNYLGILKGETDPRIAELDLAARIDAARGRVDRRLHELHQHELERRAELEKQNLAHVEKERFRTFLKLRAQAQLDAAEFELGTAGRSRPLDSARAALAVYARDPKAPDERWELATPLSAALAEAERRRVADGCYDLLLLLSRVAEPAGGLSLLDRAVRLHPEAGEAFHLRRADCLGRAGDVAGRDRALAMAQECPPASALDHFLLGRELAAGRRWAEAAGALETALRLEPDQAAAKLLLAICQYNVQPRRLGEALANLNDCLGAHPELTGLYLLRALVHGERAYEARSLRSQADASYRAAEADYRAALDRHPGDDLHYVLLVNRGGMHLRSGRIADAVADLEAAIRLNPGAYQAHATLGQLHQQFDRLDEASRELGLAIERAPDSPARLALHRARGRLYANRRDLSPGRLAAALDDLDEAIRLEPEDGEPKASDHVERARLLFGARRWDEALAACASAIAIVPDHPSAHQIRISSLMAQKRYDEVLGSCDAFLAREKPTVEVLEIRGLARLARQDFSGAIDDDTQALTLRPAPDAETRARLLNRRGWAHHFADAPRLARDDFEASLKLKPDQTDALAGRGLARVRLGQWRPAVADAEASIRLAESTSPGSTDPEAARQTYFNAARIYAQAVEFAANEVSVQGERAVALYRAYRARALDLLERSLRHVPDPARRRELLDDPALRPLRLRRGTGEMRQTSK